MATYQEQHPEEKPNTMYEHVKFINKFGFDIPEELTPAQKKMKG